jgi:hypothetical protein
MSRNVSKENKHDVESRNQSADLLRTFSDPQLHIVLQSDDSTGMPLARSYNDRQHPAFGRVDEWVNVTPTPGTPVFPKFEYAVEGVAREVIIPNESEALTFGGMEPVHLQEARKRADIARERSAERGRTRGLGIDVDGKDAEDPR